MRLRSSMPAKLGRAVPTRRQLLIGGASLALSIAALRPAAAGTRPATERRLAFRNLHTEEQLETVYWRDGDYDATALDAINHILRDHRTGEIKDIDPNLLDSLDRLQDELGTREPFQIISGYRSPKTNARLAGSSDGVAKRSLHVEGKAIDVRLASCDIATLRDAALALRAGGVGYYPKSDFVHLDIGRVRAW